MSVNTSGPDWTATLTAVATAAGAGAAIVGVVFAVLPYRRDVERRIREHASHISVWHGPSPFEASVQNTSAEAVYAVQVEFFTTDGVHIVDGIDELPVLPPQDTRPIPSADSQALNLVYLAEGTVVIEVRFTDRDGQRWLKRTDGTFRPLHWRVTEKRGPWWTRHLPTRLRRFLVRRGVIDVSAPGATKVQQRQW